MKPFIIAFIVLVSLPATSICQSRFQFLLSGGATFTPACKFQNSTGHINTAATGSLAFIYHPIATIGIELKYSNLSNPLSYLNNTKSETVRIYTSSHITFQRVLTGLNYYLPLKNIKPFIGLLGGASYVEQQQKYPYSSMFKFNWGFQIGASFNINKLLAVRFDASEIYIPNVPNNSAFFGDPANDSGFPSFIIGNPSTATIKQLNVNLGLMINLGKSKN